MHVDTLLFNNCTGCHGDAGTSGLSLSGNTAQKYAALYNVNLVCDASLNASGYRRVSGVGGNSAITLSVLLRLVDPGLTEVGACGPHLDFGAGVPQLTTLHAWIRNGAPSN